MKVSIPSGRASLATEIHGKGGPIIFLHAAVTDKRMWNAQMESVGLTNKVIAYDRRGFGESVYEKEIFSSVSDLLNVIESVTDNQRPILVGCSQGGRIALDAAVLHPSKIGGLVLIAPNIPGAPEARQSKEIINLLSQQRKAVEANNYDDVNSIKARLWLDGPLAPEHRVTGQVRELFFEMNTVVLKSHRYCAFAKFRPT